MTLAGALVMAALLPRPAAAQDTPAPEPEAAQLAAPDQLDVLPPTPGFACPADCGVNSASGPIDYAGLLDLGGDGATGADAALCAFATATLTTYSCTPSVTSFNPACLTVPSVNEVANPRMLALRNTTALGPCDTSMFAPYLRTAKDDLYLNEGTLLKPGPCPAGDRCAPIYVGNLFTGNGQLDLPQPPFLALGDDAYLSGRLPQVDADERHTVEVVSRNAHGEARTRFNLVILDVE